jgi:hypothetical protein
VRTKRMLISSAVAILIAATALVPTAGNAATPTERSASTDAAAAWLAGQFTPEGFIPDVNDDPDYANTAQSALALAAAASQEATFDAAVAFLEGHVDDYVGGSGTEGVGELGYLLLLAQAADVPAIDFGGHDLVARLESTLGDFAPGLYGAGDPTFDGAFRQGLAIVGLVSAGVAPDPLAIAWLTGQQCGPGSDVAAVGGWEPYRADTSVPCGPPDPMNFVGPDSNSTALAVEGLAAVGVAPTFDALAFLDATQEPDGGWAFIEGVGTDPNSTALVVQALVSVGEDPESAPWVEGGVSPYDSLISWQIAEGDPADVGAFASPFSDGFPDQFATQQAVWGVAGRSFPLGVVDFGGSTTSTTATTVAGDPDDPAGQSTRPQFTG